MLMTMNCPRHRSFPRNSRGASVQRASRSRRYKSTPVTTSWPSANMSASTTTFSPIVRLMGNRPLSISGVTASMTTRAAPRGLACLVFRDRGMGREFTQLAGLCASAIECQPMRIAILTNEYPPHVYGGAGVHVEYLTRELVALGEQVRVLCFGDQREALVT